MDTRTCRQCGEVVTEDTCAIRSGYTLNTCRPCMAEKQREWNRQNPVRSLYHAAKSRALTSGIEFTITQTDIIIPDVCPVFGTPFVVGDGETRGGAAPAPSLDRFDNAKGYTPENIVVISSRANRLKSNASLEELQAIVKYMEKYGRQ